MDLDLGLAANFVVLAEERHFQRAATRLHLSPSGLTKQIQHLERQLGVALIERGPAGVSRLTAAGARFATEVVPLLAHAEAVRRATQTPSPRDTVQIGFPAGSFHLRQHIGMPEVACRVRLNFPQARLVCREIVLADLGRALRDGGIDVLLANAATADSSILSTPLSLAADLIGVVSATHPLADIGAVEVGVFSDEPLLFNPTVPSEWMNPFWLADTRPRRAARLIETGESDQWSVLRQVAHGPGVTVTLAIAQPMLGPHLRPVRLIGARPMQMHIARRRLDRRPIVQTVIEAFC